MQSSLGIHLDLVQLCQHQKQYFDEGETRSLSFRIGQLKKLRSIILANEQEIVNALFNDLHKSSFEAFGSEVGQVLKEIDFAISKLKKWSAPQSVSTPLMFFPSSSKIYRDPLGTVLIIGPWNYPFLLLFAPLISAIAGGNTIILKPSEEAPHSATLIEHIISTNFAANYFHLIPR